MSISLGKRLRWAEISFSGTCHESRYEAPFGEMGAFFFPFASVWTGVAKMDLGVGWLRVILLLLFYLRVFNKCASEEEAADGEKARAGHTLTPNTLNSKT